MKDAEALAHAAQALVGVPFRLHGRDVLNGVDCIGLVSLALQGIGRTHSPLPRYAVRNVNLARFARLLPEAGLKPVRLSVALASPGDVLLLQPSAAQYHLAIVGPSSRLVHAHAGLGRVVASPTPLPWPLEARWQLNEI